MNDAYFRAKQRAQKSGLPWLCVCGAATTDPPDYDGCPSCGAPVDSYVAILPKASRVGRLDNPCSEELQASIISASLARLASLYEYVGTRAEISRAEVQITLKELAREVSYTRDNLHALYYERDERESA